MNLRKLLQPLLRPSARFDDVPSFATTVGPAPGAWTDDEEAPARRGGRVSLRSLVVNLPLMLGAALVLALLILVVFGPALAPQNPYIAGQHIVPHYDAERGEFIRPPLEPSVEFPLGTDQWGTDILSMLMHGARNTLIACAFITMVRVLLGLTLGAIAGWNEGQTSDRLIMGLIGALASLPLLISTMILIYALDIRRGLLVFIIAMSALGWAEIAQYIRSEFIVLRKMPFIEGAHAGGLTGPQIAVRHVLPNVLPQLLVITFLEMGAVLLLLGELAFVGVFIGGGSRIDLTEPFGPERIFTIAEVPEWGAMLANGHRWLRSAPFIVLPPAMAFFVAVMGFNLLGEGLRRVLEQQGVSTAFLLRKRMVAVIALLTVAVIFIMNNTGAAPWFARVAQAFSGDNVYAEVERLVEMNGRGLGQPGGAAAAAYIAGKFAEYGLEPGAKGNTYLLDQEMTLVRPTAQPTLSVLDASGAPLGNYVHQLDFGYVIEGHGGSGTARAPVTFVGFAQPGAYDWRAFDGLDLRGRVVLLAEGSAPPSFAAEALIRGAVGVLWIINNDCNSVRSQIQFADPERPYLSRPTMPILQIRPSVAETILAQDNLDFSSVMTTAATPTQSGPGWWTYDLSAQVDMSLTFGEPQVVSVPSVLGYLPGSDLDIADELVVVFVTYDGLGTDPDGTVFPGADHNASGVALLLEVVRLWQEQQLDARRTTLFAAWGGGELDESGARAWLEDSFNFRHMRTQSISANVRPQILLQLDSLGGPGEMLLVHPGTDPSLAELILDASDEVGLEAQPGADTLCFQNNIVSSRVPAWTSLKLSGQDVPPTEDTLARISRERLEAVGQMLTLTLTRIVRENTY